MRRNYFNFIIAVILTMVFVLWILISFMSPSGEYVMPTAPMTLQTTDNFSLLKKVAQERVALIKKDSGIFTPYNPIAMKIAGDAIDKATTLNELGAAFLLLPNNSIGSYPIAPLTGKPQDTTLFQFEQGTTGWYWGYATYRDQPSVGKVANIMYYIIRIDIGTPKIRKKYNLPLGSTTIYSISLGAGFGKGSWRYSPYAMCRGKYVINGPQAFEFEAQNEDGTVLVSFGSDKKSFSLDFSCKVKDNKFSTSTVFKKIKDARFNAPNGCAPCVAGDGTLYWSYTQLDASSNITVNDRTLAFTKGDGWLDHQWMRGNDPLQLGVKIMTNISQLKKSVGGLGRYVWLNVHLSDVEFMVTAFPPQSTRISKGQTYAAQFIAYPSAKPTSFKNKTVMTFEETTVVDGVTFPTVISVTLPGPDGAEKYTISSIPYGNCVTLDLTGNLHWSGSASLSDSKGNSPGTGFIELNQFQTIDRYHTAMLSMAGIDTRNLTVFSGPPLTFIQVLPSFLYLILGLELLIAMLIFLIVGIVRR